MSEDRMSVNLAAFKADVHMKLGGLTASEFVIAHPGEHLWARYLGFELCAFCGVIRNRGPMPAARPCRGIVRLGLR